MSDKDLCSISGCPRAVLARGWCSPHYRKWKRYGSPDAALRPSWRHWTPEEDRQILAALPKDGGRAEYGTSTDLALILERSPGAVWNRMTKFRRRQWESEKAAALGTPHYPKTAQETCPLLQCRAGLVGSFTLKVSGVSAGPATPLPTCPKLGPVLCYADGWRQTGVNPPPVPS